MARVQCRSNDAFGPVQAQQARTYRKALVFTKPVRSNKYKLRDAHQEPKGGESTGQVLGDSLGLRNRERRSPKELDKTPLIDLRELTKVTI